VICLLGLDDGAFPRKAPRDGDDLMLADPRVGDRDPRSEDRQLCSTRCSPPPTG
jgi:exodeoxyribonuclease V gamma subunit